MIALLVALAGGAGAASRFVVDGVVRSRTGDAFPWATVVVNVTGSFLLGLVVGATPDGRWHDVAGVGFLGGYTTFSTACVELARLAESGADPDARRHRPLNTRAAAHLLLMVGGCLVAAALGLAVTS